MPRFARPASRKPAFAPGPRQRRRPRPHGVGRDLGAAQPGERPPVLLAAAGGGAGMAGGERQPDRAAAAEQVLGVRAREDRGRGRAASPRERAAPRTRAPGRSRPSPCSSGAAPRRSPSAAAYTPPRGTMAIRVTYADGNRHRSPGNMRLAKYLASAGVASRRASEEIVRTGRSDRGRRNRHGPRPRRHDPRTRSSSMAEKFVLSNNASSTPSTNHQASSPRPRTPTAARPSSR